MKASAKFNDNLIRTVESLEKAHEVCGKKLEDKFSGKDGKRHIVICGGTGCMSSDSKVIYETLLSLIKENKLEDKVTANMVGCFGFCSQGPFVKIFPEDTLYRLVKVKDCERIIKEDIMEGKVIEDLL
jgi:(2Fe-2S) ferredoxin